MFLVGIDIGKNKHTFSATDKETGEILLKPSVFDRNWIAALWISQNPSDTSKNVEFHFLPIVIQLYFPLLKLGHNHNEDTYLIR